MKALHLADAKATDRLGQALARHRPATAVVYLLGDLGAGKSSLARALLRELGVQGAIRSPTYSLLERYPLGDGNEAWHLDLYRIGDVGELEFLGLDGGEAVLWLVEWPDRGLGGLPASDLSVEMALDGTGRQALLTPASEVGRQWLAGIAAELPFAADS